MANEYDAGEQGKKLEEKKKKGRGFLDAFVQGAGKAAKDIEEARKRREKAEDEATK
jgi:hypothetical protein